MLLWTLRNKFLTMKVPMILDFSLLILVHIFPMFVHPPFPSLLKSVLTLSIYQRQHDQWKQYWQNRVELLRLQLPLLPLQLLLLAPVLALGRTQAFSPQQRVLARVLFLVVPLVLVLLCPNLPPLLVSVVLPVLVVELEIGLFIFFDKFESIEKFNKINRVKI